MTKQHKITETLIKIKVKTFSLFLKTNSTLLRKTIIDYQRS